jgi:glycosyltransferase involved in cell wall biosynthesis
MKPELSILIPTHNRPDLFQRCLHSALDCDDYHIEIIVNNDSNDIREIKDKRVKYHYNKFDNLSAVYKFLLDQSKGEHVYFLEDDDYLAKDFYDKLVLDSDIIVGNYMPCHDLKNMLNYSMMYMNEYSTSDIFEKNIDSQKLQLGQFIFRRNTIKDWIFPENSDIHNDELLVRYALQNAEMVRSLNRVFYHQTQDGGDNISFPE